MTDMTKVVDAARRLERAVLRLEAALERSGTDADRSEIEGALAAARARYVLLSQVTQTVALRLDQAIGRLDRMLEG